MDRLKVDRFEKGQGWLGIWMENGAFLSSEENHWSGTNIALTEPVRWVWQLAGNPEWRVVTCSKEFRVSTEGGYRPYGWVHLFFRGLLATGRPDGIKNGRVYAD